MKTPQERFDLFFQQNNRMPSYSEISTLFGFASKQASFRLAQKLIDQEFLVKTTRGILAPGPKFGNLRVLGSVQAGFPTGAQEDETDSLNLDQWLIQNKAATYMLTVSGDSMKDAGILEGDTVLVEKTNTHKPGDIVVAEVDGMWTLKYLRKKRNALYLEAANTRYGDIHPKQSLRIAAVVKAVIRKF
jgi:repressor LexA